MSVPIQYLINYTKGSSRLATFFLYSFMAFPAKNSTIIGQKQSRRFAGLAGPGHSGSPIFRISSARPSPGPARPTGPADPAAVCRRPCQLSASLTSATHCIALWSALTAVAFACTAARAHPCPPALHLRPRLFGISVNDVD